MLSLAGSGRFAIEKAGILKPEGIRYHLVMKIFSALFLSVVCFVGCSSSDPPPEPIQRTGATLDHAMHKLKYGAKKVGHKIENAFDGD